jgi:hypothetical protein
MLGRSVFVKSLHAAAQDGEPAFMQEMHPSAAPAIKSEPHTFSLRTPANRSAADFTPRILPYHALAPPTEIHRILWQK